MGEWIYEIGSFLFLAYIGYLIHPALVKLGIKEKEVWED